MKRPLLLPLIPLYAAGIALRELCLERGWEPVRRLRDPVISIGNLSTGGSGKTPLSIALARLLTARGFYVDVLSRGYGRRSRAPMRVDPNGFADQYGDEPLLIAHRTRVPVYVAAERYEAGKLAEAEGKADQAPRVHIVDDGFQHRQLARDIDVLLVRQSDLHDSLLPGGDLREPLNSFDRASVIVVSDDEPEVEKFFTAKMPIGTNSEGAPWSGPIWHTRRRMEIPQIVGPVAAFCGIARPEQFFAGLRAAGMALAFHRAFADHHHYSARDIAEIVSTARSAHAVAVITTEKDKVRLGRLAFPSDLPLKVAGLTLEIEDEDSVAAWIEARVGVGSKEQG